METGEVDPRFRNQRRKTGQKIERAVRGIHIGVSRENPDHEKIAADFNKAIADMKKDGSYDLIVSRHYIYIKKPAQ